MTEPLNYAHNVDISLMDDIKLSMLDKFPSLQKDEVTRLAIVSFDEKKNPRLKMSEYFFDQTQNFGFLAPINKESLAKVVARLGEPKIKFGTIVVKYTTDMMGNLVGDPPGFAFYAWLFSHDKFKPLKALHKEWNLFQRDLIVTCQDKAYQKFVISPAQDCVWTSLPNADTVLETANLLYESQIEKFFNREVPDAELFIKLGFVAAPSQPMAVSPFNANRAITQGVGNPANVFSTLIKSPPVGVK